MGRLAWLGVVCSCAVACGDDGGGGVTDAAPTIDAALIDAHTTLNEGACPTSYGPAAIAMTFAVPDDDTIGFDLDGDQEVDNLLSGIAPVINQSFAQDLEDGSLLTIAELRGLDNGIGSDDSEVDLVVYGGVDLDDDVMNNFTGDADYYYAHDWVDLNDCSPLALARGSYENGTLTTEQADIQLQIETLGGLVTFARSHILVTLEADTEGAKTPTDNPALFGGVVLPCDLANADGTFGESAHHDLFRLMMQADIDMDGDGLEVVEGDSLGIIRCIDGDGVTTVEGPMCGCDPRIADGYSIAFELDMVGATVLGPEPSM